MQVREGIKGDCEGRGAQMEAMASAHTRTVSVSGKYVKYRRSRPVSRDTQRDGMWKDPRLIHPVQLERPRHSGPRGSARVYNTYQYPGLLGAF